MVCWSSSNLKNAYVPFRLRNFLQRRFISETFANHAFIVFSKPHAKFQRVDNLLLNI